MTQGSTKHGISQSADERANMLLFSCIIMSVLSLFLLINNRQVSESVVPLVNIYSILVHTMARAEGMCYVVRPM